MTAKVKVVIDYEVDSPQATESLIRRIINIKKYYQEQVNIEVTAYGAGIDLVLNNNGNFDQLSHLAESGVSFLACQNTMVRRGLSKENILNEADIVPSGLGHIIDRQLEGWAYLKL